MTKLASLARVAMLAGLLLAAVGTTGCRMYPAGSCSSCGCGSCASCGSAGMAMGGQGCGCGGGLMAGKKMHGHEIAEAAPPAMPAPHARFHPVPTRPVFSQRGPTLATREVEVQTEVEFDLQRDSTASVIRSLESTAAGVQSPRVARRPAERELPLESPSGAPTPATRPNEPPAPAEPRELPVIQQGASLMPQPASSVSPRRAVVSTFDPPAGQLEPAVASELAVQPTSAQATQAEADGGAWRPQLMVR